MKQTKIHIADNVQGGYLCPADHHKPGEWISLGAFITLAYYAGWTPKPPELCKNCLKAYKRLEGKL